MKKVLFAITAVLLMSICKTAQSCEDDEVVGVNTGNCIKKSGTCGTGCSYTIDGDGNLVVSGTGSIGQSAFINNKDIVNTTIEYGIKGLGDQSFYGVSNMETISIPNSVTRTGSRLFQGASSLKSVDIPDSVTSFSTYVTFYGCDNLEYVHLPKNLRSAVNAYFITSSKVNFVVPEGLYYADSYGCCGYGSVTQGNVYCTGAQIEKGICGSKAIRYEKDGENYIIYNKDGSVKEIMNDFDDFSEKAYKGFEDRTISTNEDGSVVAEYPNGSKITYDGHGNILSQLINNPDGSYAIYDGNGNLNKMQKRGPLTIEEADAATKKGNVNKLTITW